MLTSDADSGDVAGVRLTHRSLVREEAACLHEELKSTPNILGYTTSELLRFSNVLIAQVAQGDSKAVFAGVCISKDLLFGWTDIAALYVLPEFRGCGISRLLFESALNRAQANKRHIYVLSRSPAVVHLMEQNGLTISRAVWKAPLAVHLHTQKHMTSIYRMREAARKSKMRMEDGQSFIAGTKRWQG